MRFLLLVATALMLVPVAWAGTARLTITVWPKGKSGPSTTWTLRCGPVGGTLPSPGRACRALARHPEALRPVPKDIAAWLNRTNGCEIDRWNALKALFPD